MCAGALHVRFEHRFKILPLGKGQLQNGFVIIGKEQIAHGLLIFAHGQRLLPEGAQDVAEQIGGALHTSDPRVVKGKGQLHRFRCFLQRAEREGGRVHAAQSVADVGAVHGVDHLLSAVGVAEIFIALALAAKYREVAGLAHFLDPGVHQRFHVAFTACAGMYRYRPDEARPQGIAADRKRLGQACDLRAQSSIF